MKRIAGMLAGATSAAVVVAGLTGIHGAAAAPQPRPDSPRESVATPAKADDRPDRLESRRRDLKQEATELVLSGERQVQQRGGSRAVRVAPGQWAQYGLQDSDQLLSFLVEFGDGSKPGGKAGGKTGGKDTSTDGSASGPLHNQIPQPGSSDNSTYWKPDFNRQHYLDMFFNGMADQGGESFTQIYEEMSSGRYTVSGDVSEWVKVAKPESAYGTTESHTDMTYFIDDTAEAWYADQLARGKTKAEVVAYLKSFDTWDRYDHDLDGNFAEADGYIDHFQAIHAGEGEEAGAPEWAIWSHRWAVNQNFFHADGSGPVGAEFGGIQIGDTGLWIRDYTTEPENGGLGVFVHEYGHDLGLPDLYDTSGGENGTSFWTLMSSGSWLSHGDGAIGTTPNHMGPWEKLQLGWLDYEVARAGTTSTHDLGPSYHATKKAQAVITVLPKKSEATQLGAAAEGTDFFYSGRGDDRTATLASPTFTVPVGGTLTAQVKYDIEADWDYAYAEYRPDGSTSWTPLATNLSTTTDPNGTNEGHGITGTTGGAWTTLDAALPSSLAGSAAQVRFRMVNDEYYNETGLLVDDIRVSGLPVQGGEDGAAGWVMDEFVIAENGTASRAYNHYYIAENRAYAGYDRTLQEGPYNFGWSLSQPNRVEHFPYQDGLLVWYWDTSFADNNTQEHAGHGEVLPVDANPHPLTWSDGVIARNRVQSFDSTFGLATTDPISLHRETASGMTTLTVPSRRGVAVFDDTDPERYYDPSNPWHSAIVAGTGTRIEVVSTTQNGTMQITVR